MWQNPATGITANVCAQDKQKLPKSYFYSIIVCTVINHGTTPKLFTQPIDKKHAYDKGQQ